jgi:hypothetical protein
MDKYLTIAQEQLPLQVFEYEIPLWYGAVVLAIIALAIIFVVKKLRK